MRANSLSCAALVAAVVALVCAISPAAAATNKNAPVFVDMPFTFSGNETAGFSGLRNNDALFFLNATAGATGLIQLQMNVTDGAVKLQACTVEICFRSAAAVNGKAATRARKAPAAVTAGGAPWLLVADGELSDAVPWWFWLSNAEPLAPASGTLRVTLLETVVVNATNTSATVSLAGGEQRLFKVQSAAGTGGALQISYTEQDSGSFQFFAPSDVVLPSIVLQGDLDRQGRYYDGYNIFSDLTRDSYYPMSLSTPQRSGDYFPANVSSTDGATWWVVAGSRNGQATNATISFNRVATTQLTSDVVTPVTLTQATQVAVLRLPAAAGLSGHVIANATWTQPAGTTITARVFAGDLTQELDTTFLTNDGARNSFLAGSSFASGAASICLWDDDTTDWWVLVQADSMSTFTTGAIAVSVQLRHVATALPDASTGAVSVTVDPLDMPLRLIKVAGVAGGVALRVRADEGDFATATLSSVSGATFVGDGLPGTICGGTSQLRYTQPPTSASTLALDQLYLAAWEGLDWYLVVTHNAGGGTNTLRIEQLTATPLELGASGANVTLFEDEQSFELDARIFRITASNTTAAATPRAGLDVSYTLRANSTGFYPGQASGAEVPTYIVGESGRLLNVLVSSDIVAPHGFFNGPTPLYTYDATTNYACAGKCTDMPASADVRSVTTTSRFWTDQYNLRYISPPQRGLTGANRTALAQLHGLGNSAASRQLLNSRAVADDTLAERTWYIAVVGNLVPLLDLPGPTDPSNLEPGVNFTLPLQISATLAPILPLASGVPVLSPPSPQNLAYDDIATPGYQALLYRLPSGGAGTSGLVSATTSGGSSCNAASLVVSPAARYTSRGYEQAVKGFGASLLDFDNYESYLFESQSYAWTSYYSSPGYMDFHNTYNWQTYADRALVLDESAETGSTVRYAWLQAADNADDVDWYVTLITKINTPACSFVLTLHDTVVLADNVVDEFGLMQWGVSGLPVSPLSQTLFKLPARYTQRGMITAITLSDTDTSEALDLLTGPLALTLQAQTVPAAHASLPDAYWQAMHNSEQISYPGPFYYGYAGQLWSLPFVPITRTGAESSYSDVTFGDAGAFIGSQTGTNNDYSDVYLLGVARNNFTQGTQVLDLSIAVSATRVFCNNKATCNGKGKCLSDGSCKCNSGYGGQFCTCRDKRDCSGHGVCGLAQGCVCDSGYSGADCSRSGASALAVASLLVVVIGAIFAALL